MNRITPVLEALELESIRRDAFRGPTSRQHASAKQVFGGHILAQALRSAQLTLPHGRLVHSLHSYFVKSGGFDAPFEYAVTRVRDGGAFSLREVVARQGGDEVLRMMVSAVSESTDVVYGASPPPAEPPTALPPLQARMSAYAHELDGWWARDRPFELRYASTPPRAAVDSGAAIDPGTAWLRTHGSVIADDSIHACLLAYASDMSILDPIMVRNPDAVRLGNAGLASLDHSMWFHQSLDVSTWFRYDVSTSAGTARRGLAWGHISREDGSPACTVMQEGLLRRPPRTQE